MLLSAFTAFHVAVSLAAILSGFVVVYGLIGNRALPRWTSFFLATTVVTNVTGFLFPFHGITPGQVVGVLSLITLGLAYIGRRRWLANRTWRKTYVISMLVALYFNVFVLVVQLFEKVPSLKALAPTQQEAPFKVSQLVVLLVFVSLGILSVRRFRGETLQVLSKAA